MHDDVISLAVEKAAHWHHGQVDKSGQPYIFHPLRVMLLARDRGVAPALQAAAVMHDLIEDTGFDEEEMRALFPAETCEAVLHLTKREGESYDAFITRICEAPVDVITLKLCDITDNTSPARAVTEALRALAVTKYEPARRRLEEAIRRRAG